MRGRMPIVTNGTNLMTEFTETVSPVSRRRVTHVGLAAALAGMFGAARASEEQAKSEAAKSAKPGLSGPALQEEAIRISKLLRCPASPNLTLYESEAAIASELKGRIFMMLKDGKTREEIIDWMVERYGEQISYMPDVNAGTAPLWVAPWAALAVAGGLVVWRMRRKTSKRRDEANE